MTLLLHAGAKPVEYDALRVLDTPPATPVVVTSGDVQGNVGSCAVNTSSVQVNAFQIHTYAVNSCDGKIVGDYVYTDWLCIALAGLVIMFAVLIGTFFVKLLND